MPISSFQPVRVGLQLLVISALFYSVSAFAKKVSLNNRADVKNWQVGDELKNGCLVKKLALKNGIQFLGIECKDGTKISMEFPVKNASVSKK